MSPEEGNAVIEKRVMIRITYPSLSLVEAAELEGKLEEVMAEYGPHSVEITALTPPVRPIRP